MTTATSYRTERKDTVLIIGGYALCVLLVPLYVNMFPVWKYISTIWGSGVFKVLPVFALAGLLGGIFLAMWLQRIRPGPPAAAVTRNWFPVAGGLLLCLLGLAITDPAFPVKRIHVTEYLLLSLIARAVMSLRLQGAPLLFYSALFAAVLGIHDEFLQGLHPARTYGLNDMAVNGLGALGGALIWHGTGLFGTPRKTRTNADQKASSVVERLYLGWLCFSVFALIVPLFFLRGLALPLWPSLPLLGAMVFFTVYLQRFSSKSLHGLGALSAATGALVIYPLLGQFSDDPILLVTR